MRAHFAAARNSARTASRNSFAQVSVLLRKSFRSDFKRTRARRMPKPQRCVEVYSFLDFAPALRASDWMYRMMRNATGMSVPRKIARYAGNVTSILAASSWLVVASSAIDIFGAAAARRVERDATATLRTLTAPPRTNALPLTAPAPTNAAIASYL
eukprot:CAMPEP_0185835780 /NCGR_PEP_ID=MMETSP1353-20130828/8444_1 /TAXON_ID=1077150 /ORGANISM="Erythrolobus australicus, Strain CCMP3124" /LENGTH=155 /DNA_ID=CAMNT_0028534463 /DNA_START=238 /DNA_END=705 /DNA_ORIENTATION=+